MAPTSEGTIGAGIVRWPSRAGWLIVSPSSRELSMDWLWLSSVLGTLDYTARAAFLIFLVSHFEGVQR